MLPASARGPQGGKRWSAGAAARLAVPRERGTTAAAKRRALQEEYEAYAQETAAALVPEAPEPVRAGFALGDPWHTAGEDGYRSAAFHAAVRCRELLQDAGLAEECAEAEAGAQVLQGHGAAAPPELARLHCACLLLEELCGVVSPLQDTLRFLARELCCCIFEAFRPGGDVARLTPFFMLALQAREATAAEHQRAEAAERELQRRGQRIDELQRELREVRGMLQWERDRARREEEAKQSLVEERNGLRTKVQQLQDIAAIRSDELRELSTELAGWQGSAYESSRELERARREAGALATQLKEEQAQAAALRARLSDLQGTLQLGSGGLGPGEAPAPAALAPGAAPGALGAPPEAAPRRRSAARGEGPETGEAEGRGDGRRLLRLRLADGGVQVVLRGAAAAEGGRELQPVAPAGKAAAPALLASPEAFAALCISSSLPQPLDLMQMSSSPNGSDGVVEEVQAEVQALAQEHGALVELFRNLQRELKETLRLVPRWNSDELRGILQSVAVLDPEEEPLVPSPVASSAAMVGLGEGPRVPPFLRYDGLLAFHPMHRQEVLARCDDLWLARTRAYLASVHEGPTLAPLAEFLDGVYLPGVSGQRGQQMEFCYNFLLAVRGETSLAEQQLRVTILGATGLAAMNAEGEAQGRQRGFQGAYCLCEVAGRGGLAHRTGAIDSDSPSWNSEAVFERYHLGEGLSFAVLRRDETLGRAALPAGRFYPGGFEGELPLAPPADAEGAAGASGARLRVRVTPRAPGGPAGGAAAAAAASEPPRRRAGPGAAPAGAAPARPLEGAPALAAASFCAAPEALYRGLLGHLHEDFYHDQTAMLAALRCALLALGERFRPAHCAAEPGGLLLLGLAELSAVLRLFFPVKPREHLNALKHLLAGHLRRTAAPPPEEAAGAGEAPQGEAQPSRAPSKSVGAARPPVVDLEAAFGLRANCDSEEALSSLVACQLPLLQELRRQHLAEAFMFLDRLRRAFRVILHTWRSEGAGGDGHALVTAQQADAALAAADQHLSEDQRRLYLLRGFGRRLPDLPNCLGASAALTPEACSRARALLRERSAQLAEDDATLSAEAFVRQLAASGVAKGAQLWVPDLGAADVARAGGLLLARPETPSAPLAEFITARAQKSAPESPEPGGAAAAGRLERFRAHVEAGAGAQEFSVGYPWLALRHWVAWRS